MASATSAGAFDAHHPPDPALIKDCVHCGFCLPTCPTYVLWGEEMDSPRGRIHLMKQGVEGAPMTTEMVRHFDLCLGCMACMTACPSGVKYGALIESTRQQVERRHTRSVADAALRAAIFSLFPYPSRLWFARAALAAYQRLGVKRVVERTGLLERLPARLRALALLQPELRHVEDVPAWTPARGAERRKVGLLTGCVQRVFFSHVNAATVRVLSAEGCGVAAPPEQGCCGALSLHAGREAEAQEFARRTIDEFETAKVDAIVVNAAGCGSAMKEYGYLLRDDPAYAERAAQFSSRVRDLSEFIVEIGSRAVGQGTFPNVRAAYQDACHLAHAQGIRRQPRELLRRIPGLDLRELSEPEICCGSAGIYNLVEPEPARELGDRKAGRVEATGAELIITSNPGCLLQIRAALRRRGSNVRVVHIAEVLDASRSGGVGL
jgi:glycolate oxidase iron-sulfur subunit